MWFTLDPAGLKPLDQLEGFFAPEDPRNFYERVWVRDELSGDVEGYVYVFRSAQAQGLRPVPDAYDFWPDWARSPEKKAI